MDDPGERALREANQMWQSLFGKEHPDTLKTAFYLASLLTRAKANMLSPLKSSVNSYVCERACLGQSIGRR